MRSIVVLLCIVSVSLGWAQPEKPKNYRRFDDKVIHFGFMLGFNTANFRAIPQQDAYAQYGLASKIIFSFNTKDYKLPNGITLEFGDDEPVSKQKLLKNKKGSIEISYTHYSINKGIPPHIF